MIVAVKVYTKLFNLSPLRHFFGSLSYIIFLLSQFQNGTLFLQRFAPGKCKARKGQLQIICGNIIETEDVTREY